MIEITENPKMVEKAYLIGIRRGRDTREAIEEHLDELAQLADTLGVPVVGREVVSVGRPSPTYLIGSGKADEIVVNAQLAEADCLIFDDELNPAQQRNWEKLAKIAVIDRHEIILDIFAKHARTKEARLQVQLARLEYQLPRLRRAWTHLERQRGGAGMRGGAGELQLETDQRLVRDRLVSIKKDLETLKLQRSTQRKARGLRPTPGAVIVGYTNAGKSSLLRALTDADILCENKLFATLDPTTRRLVLPNNQELLLTDTVGFIRKLPHDLVESFKATLEETVLADFLVHVVDVSHPQARAHIEATNTVLEELGARDKPTLLILNKVDLVEDPASFPFHEFYPLGDHSVAVSTVTGEGLPKLLDALAALYPAEMEALVLEVPADRHDVVSLAHREGVVRFKSYLPGATWLAADFPRRLRHKVEAFLRPALPEHLEDDSPNTPDEEDAPTRSGEVEGLVLGT